MSICFVIHEEYILFFGGLELVAPNEIIEAAGDNKMFYCSVVLRQRTYHVLIQCSLVSFILFNINFKGLYALTDLEF